MCSKLLALVDVACTCVVWLFILMSYIYHSMLLCRWRQPMFALTIDRAICLLFSWLMTSTGSCFVKAVFVVFIVSSARLAAGRPECGRWPLTVHYASNISAGH